MSGDFSPDFGPDFGPASSNPTATGAGLTAGAQNVASFTAFPYVPSQVAPFAFSPTLDGIVYNCTVTWSLFGQRLYLNIFAVDGTWILTTALAGSPAGISLQSVTWANGRAIAQAVSPHGIMVGGLATVTIAGMVPAAYNGQVQAIALSPTEFAWPLAANPGMATVLGQVFYNINLVGGMTDPNTGALLATTSTLVFRQPSQTFEVTP